MISVQRFIVAQSLRDQVTVSPMTSSITLRLSDTFWGWEWGRCVVGAKALSSWQRSEQEGGEREQDPSVPWKAHTQCWKDLRLDTASWGLHHIPETLSRGRSLQWMGIWGTFQVHDRDHFVYWTVKSHILLILKLLLLLLLCMFGVCVCVMHMP